MTLLFNDTTMLQQLSTTPHDTDPQGEIFLLQASKEQSAQFQPLQFFELLTQPEPYQRKSYTNSIRKEYRHFKPQILKITAKDYLQSMIKNGTAILKIVNESKEPVEEPPLVCDINQETKSFCFNPAVSKTSKGKEYRLQFTINFELDDGEQRTEIIHSNKFRIVSRAMESQHKS